MHRISSLRRRGRAAGAGQGGKQKLSRTGDKLQAAGRADDAMTMTVRPVLFLDLFRERYVLAQQNAG